MKSINGTQEGYDSEAIREMEIIQNLRHPNISSIKDVLWDKDGNIAFTSEVAWTGDLADLMKEVRTKQEPFSEKDLMSIVFQILDGLSFLHHKGIGHWDIKPQNVIIKTPLLAEIIDFGTAKVVGENGTTTDIGGEESSLTWTGKVGTPTHMAPEIITAWKGKKKITPYCPKRADMWSFGVILY